ncbi:hypothetical protein OJAV_G00236710 [Oryzias javanicus]|uniref:Uncharacterized protein n=1 Tax=Oryzias javanicus TaxID=123683 RepID=A0A437BYE5_ORYJA|nr:hypothetical protein OJAV_G00236710 [Oryzias javanicus]
MIDRVSRRIAALIYPGPWLENTGRDLEIFPKQMSSNCCGIFMLMYALSICTSSEMTFTEGDMPAIRLWWCLQSMERFCTDGHGHRFAIQSSKGNHLQTLRCFDNRKKGGTEDTIQRYPPGYCNPFY